jgi:eukaryotic-like serine/threonine-protein kinase
MANQGVDPEIDSNPDHSQLTRHSTADHSEQDFVELRSLKRQLVSELRAGWEADEPEPAEEVLERWPGDANDPDIASLLFEEYLQRCRRGEDPSPKEYEERFPSQKQAFAAVARQQEFMQAMGCQEPKSGLTLALPEVGAQVFGFRLCHELGRGSFARVFLAEQISLAGRPVVVKVSAIDGDEPQTLAQLQHTHIVPIYSVHEDEAAGLRVVCMPYFGGASLSRILETVFERSPVPQHGSEIVAALADVQAPARRTTQPAGAAADQTPLARLGRVDYVRASVWIILQLAEALEHAHERGVLHRDIKPSNVLIGADGEPMLLDFNLAQKQEAGQAQVTATLGGTVAYMAPEHLRALAARDPALARSVDHRADIYGLGMVLFELLTGRRPFDQSGSYSPLPALIEAMALERGRAAPSLRALRPRTAWSLESIISKCLAADAGHRYQSAQELAEDLRRFLDDRPLRYAPELSWKERLAKWRRRHPRLTTSGAIAAAALAIIGCGTAILLTTMAKLHSTEQKAEEAAGSVAREHLRQFEAGVERARCVVHTTSDAQGHVDQSRAVCQEALAIYSFLAGEDWREPDEWHRLEPEEQQRLRDKGQELLLLLADAKLREAQTRKLLPGDVCSMLAALAPEPVAISVSGLLAAAEQLCQKREKTWQRAVAMAAQDGLVLLQRAEKLGEGIPSAALWEERAKLLEQLDRKAEASAAKAKAVQMPRRSAADHYAFASTLSLQGRYAAALPELKEAYAIDPRNYWVLFHMGICHYELGDYPQALADFRCCVTLWPEFSLGLFNLGQVLHRLGRLPEAIDAYSSALRYDRKLATANLNRGLVYLEIQSHARALDDFDAALAAGVDGAVAWGGRGIALEALGRHREADAAFEHAWDEDAENIPMLLGYGFAVSQRLPKRAEAAFQRVLRWDNKNPRALYGYAMLSARASRQSEAALDCFTLALDADPSFLAARRGRADVLAHRGERAKALEDINWCVKEDPSGATLYSAACVYATLALQCREPATVSELTERAVSFLEAAFQRGYGEDRAAQDEDLEALRNHPRFRALIRKLQSGNERKSRNQI